MKAMIALVKRLAIRLSNQKTVAKCLVMLFCLPMCVQAEIFSARVIAIMDGDTVLVLRDCARAEPETQEVPRRSPCVGAQKIKIRLANIDAPEVGHAGMGGKPPNSQIDQAFGRQSRDSLLEMLNKKQVQIDSKAIDQYGRMVGLISVDGRDVNQEQVRRGMAWEYSHYHSDKTYIGLQSEAQQARRGLWAQTSPQAPWQWRRGHVTGEASRLRETPPAARSTSEGLPPDDFGRRKLHPSTAPVYHVKPAGHAATALYDLECGKKRYCPQMSSCDEAHFYLARCGVQTLDRNKDGIPCEDLCAGSK